MFVARGHGLMDVKIPSHSAVPIAKKNGSIGYSVTIFRYFWVVLFT